MQAAGSNVGNDGQSRTEVLHCLWTWLLVCCFSSSFIWHSAPEFWEFAQPIAKILSDILLLVI